MNDDTGDTTGDTTGETTGETKRTESKNFHQDRPGGYFTPKGIDRSAERHDRDALAANVRLLGDTLPAETRSVRPVSPRYFAEGPDSELHVGDCRDVLANLPQKGAVDLIFADPPFNWDVPYAGWKDGMPRAAYERFTFDWLDLAVECLAPHGSLWVNVADDMAAEVVMHLKRRKLALMNWCVWHFRFGHNRDTSFILAKTHALWFARDAENTHWNPDAVLEPTDRSTLYGDSRTQTKMHGSQGMRVPFDVWYGPFWGRVHSKNSERRPLHQNQLPEVYLERVILSTSRPGDLVVDPFAGSGTTGTVARAWNRQSTSIEISEDLAASAWERITKIGMIHQGRSRISFDTAKRAIQLFKLGSIDEADVSRE